MSVKQIVYVVTAELERERVRKIVESLNKHESLEFISETDVRFISPSELEDTICFKQIQENSMLLSTWRRITTGRERSNLSITTPELNEQAVLLFDLGRNDPRAILHEFGHCSAVKTGMGAELRSEYQRVSRDLDRVIGTGYPRQLAEGIIHLPEDGWIEIRIVQYAAQDGNNLGTSAETYLKNTLEAYTDSLKIVQENENRDSVLTALHRFYNCLNCLIFGEIARSVTPSTSVDTKFLELSKRFHDSIDLTGVDVSGLWNLTKVATMRPWVEQCATTLTRIVMSARMR